MKEQLSRIEVPSSKDLSSIYIHATLVMKSPNHVHSGAQPRRLHSFHACFQSSKYVVYGAECLHPKHHVSSPPAASNSLIISGY
jgi:hypothetical protein